jgi:hypothetical protein
MTRQQQRFNQRFPYGRDSWKFARPVRITTFTGGEFSLAPSPTYDTVEIPAEIVEHIYKMGWGDAMQDIREMLK